LAVRPIRGFDRESEDSYHFRLRVAAARARVATIVISMEVDEGLDVYAGLESDPPGNATVEIRGRS
jgi:hypothetical protein